MAPISLEHEVTESQHTQGNGNHTVTKSGEAFSAGRLKKLMSPLLQEWNEKPRLRAELNKLPLVLRVDRAHVVMLAEQDIISKHQACALLEQLNRIGQAGPSALKIEPGFGSIVLQMEQELTRMLGEDIAGRLPIARSRLDQGATVRRMADRDAILVTTDELQNFQKTIINTANKYRNVNMIHYTHLQQAQPANFGHWLLAFNDRLQDPFTGLQRAYDQTDRCPLGAVGLCGTNMPIDRYRTAELLGFSSVLKNSRLGRDAYDQIVIIFELSMIMTVLNDLCTDLHIFSSNEFRTVESDDSHCQTSSVFPHKKNPYGLEAIKINAASAHGWMANALALFRNEGTGDHSSRNVGILAEAYRATQGMLQLASEILEHLTVHDKRWEELLDKAWVTTNLLGNTLLAEHGLSYRTAHGVVARLVKNAVDRNVDKADVTITMLQEAAAEMGVERIDMTQAQLTVSLDHSEFVRSSHSLGGVGRNQVTKLLNEARSQLDKNQSWIEERRADLEHADAKLAAAERVLLDS